PPGAGAPLLARLLRARDGAGAQPQRDQRQGVAVPGTQPRRAGSLEDDVNDDPEQLDQHVEDLLQDRRPERTPLPDEAALRARQTAAMLRAAKPGAGQPQKEFAGLMERAVRGWAGG